MLRHIKTALAEVRAGENLDLYVTIVLAVIVAVLSVFQIVQLELVISVLLTVIAIIASALIVNRRITGELSRTNQQVKSALDEIKASIVRKPLAADVFREGYPDFKSMLNAATSVSVLGAVLSTSVSRYNSDFVKLLERGGTIRMLISEPTPEVLKMQSFRSSTIQDNDFLISTSRNSIKSIKAISERAPFQGNLDLRTMPYLPPYGIIIITEPNDLSTVFVRISSFRVSATEQPTFEVNNQDDKEWFAFYAQQFEYMWNEADKIDLS